MLLVPGTFNDDKGWGDVGPEGGLIEACAVLDEREAVGGPEEKIDRFGVLNKVCGGEDGPAGGAFSDVVARSSSGTAAELL